VRTKIKHIDAVFNELKKIEFKITENIYLFLLKNYKLNIKKFPNLK